jgi:hypothetical protein
MLGVSDCIANCVWLAVALTEWQRIGNQIDAEFITNPFLPRNRAELLVGHSDST